MNEYEEIEIKHNIWCIGNFIFWICYMFFVFQGLILLVNEKELIDKDKTIGLSYFLKLKNSKTIKSLALLFKKEIII